MFNNGSIAGLGAPVPDALPDSTEVDETAISPPVSRFDPRVSAINQIVILPGDSFLIPFTIRNAGSEADTITISVQSNSSWADISGLPNSLNLGPGETVKVSIPFLIPFSALDGESTIVSVRVQSTRNPLMIDSAQIKATVSSQDTDGDGIPDVVDNCPTVLNPSQADKNGNGIGDACDNTPPVANAGANQIDRQGSLVTLNGSTSFDPDNAPSPISYSWQQSAGPNAALSNVSSATPTYSPFAPGIYTFSLTVNDGQSSSAPSSVNITVPLLGDIDLDGDVDNNDLNLVLAARSKPTNGPNDLRDLDGDSMITALDARKLTLLCTRPRCAVQ